MNAGSRSSLDRDRSGINVTFQVHAEPVPESAQPDWPGHEEGAGRPWE